MSVPTNQHFAALFGAISGDAFDLKTLIETVLQTTEGSAGAVLAAGAMLAARIGATADRAFAACDGDAIPVNDAAGWLFSEKALEALSALKGDAE